MCWCRPGLLAGIGRLFSTFMQRKCESEARPYPALRIWLRVPKVDAPAMLLDDLGYDRKS